MMKSLFAITALTGSMLLAPAAGFAADQQKDQPRDQDKTQTQDQMMDQIYGSQLMSEPERNEYRKQMHAAKTAEERKRIRYEHHKQMKIRAQEKGITLPDEPPMQGKGMDPGMGMGR